MAAKDVRRAASEARDFVESAGTPGTHLTVSFVGDTMFGVR
jgi:hypothetical protein